MPEVHINRPGFTYSAFGAFTKNKERKQKNEKTGYARYFYQNRLSKVCFQYDIAYGDFKYLNRRTTADKVLSNKEFNIAKNRKYDGFQRGIVSMIYESFAKKISGGTDKYEIVSKKELEGELYKPVIRKLDKRKVQPPIEDICCSDIADMQLNSTFNRGFRLLSYVGLHGLFP